jgi:hypothetical protein
MMVSNEDPKDGGISSPNSSTATSATSTTGGVRVADAKLISLITSQLRSNFLFMSLDDDAIAEVARQFEIVEYEPGHVIVEQGNEKMCFDA